MVLPELKLTTRLPPPDGKSMKLEKPLLQFSENVVPVLVLFAVESTFAAEQSILISVR
jgi:hypothetical protein